MKTTSMMALLLGVAVVSVLVVWQGLETVVALLANAGWPLLLVCLFAPLDQFASSQAWRVLFPAAGRPRTFEALTASWMGSAVNNLLPVASIGGELVKARVIAFRSYPAVDALSTVVVDKTAQAITVLLWALVGIAMLAGASADAALVTGALTGAGLLALGIGGFIAVQLLGGFSAAARPTAKILPGNRIPDLVAGADALDDAIREIYRRIGAVAASCAWRLAGRVILVPEVPLAAYLMGHPIGMAEAVLISGLIVGLKGVAFAVPGALGVQEGGYIAIGALVGIPVDLMLAVSLATRIREIVPSIPFLLAWQHMEGQVLIRRRAEEGTNGPGRPD